MNGFHVSEALKWHAKDTTQEIWHSKHVGVRERKEQIKEAIRQMKLADETGSPCDMRMIIVENARVYRTCSPVSKHVQPGWYDDLWFTESDPVSILFWFSLRNNEA